MRFLQPLPERFPSDHACQDRHRRQAPQNHSREHAAVDHPAPERDRGYDQNLGETQDGAGARAARDHRAKQRSDDSCVQQPAPPVADDADDRQRQNGFDEGGVLVVINEGAERSGVRTRIEDPKYFAGRRREEGEDRNDCQDAREDQRRAQKTLAAVSVAIQIRGEHEGGQVRHPAQGGIKSSDAIDGPPGGHLQRAPRSGRRNHPSSEGES